MGQVHLNFIFYFHHICLLWEICDIKMFLFLFIADFCMPINADHNSNRLKSHLLPPVSNDCKFSLFSSHFAIYRKCSHIWITFHCNFYGTMSIICLFFLHKVHIFCFYLTFSLRHRMCVCVCLYVHIVNRKVESCHQTTSFRTFKPTKPGCIYNLSKLISFYIVMKRVSKRLQHCHCNTFLHNFYRTNLFMVLYLFILLYEWIWNFYDSRQNRNLIWFWFAKTWSCYLGGLLSVTRMAKFIEWKEFKQISVLKREINIQNGGY